MKKFYKIAVFDLVSTGFNMYCDVVNEDILIERLEILIDGFFTRLSINDYNIDNPTIEADNNRVVINAEDASLAIEWNEFEDDEYELFNR